MTFVLFTSGMELESVDLTHGQFSEVIETNNTNTNSSSQSNLTSSESNTAKNAEIVLLSQKLKKESGGYRDLIGQVKNIGNDAALVVVIRSMFMIRMAM